MGEGGVSCERGDEVRVGKVERSVREGVVRVRRERKGWEQRD